MNKTMQDWHQRYSDESYVYGTQPNEFLQYATKYMDRGKSLLSIAEGEGRNAVYLARQGFAVTAWDFAASGIEKIHKLADSHQVHVDTQLVDLADVNWEQQQWDQIIMIFGHFDSPLRQHVCQGITQALKPGGRWIAEVYSTSQLRYGTGGPKELSYLYEPTQLLSYVKDWNIEHFFTGEVERYEGNLHHGLSHVVQLVVQKPVQR